MRKYLPGYTASFYYREEEYLKKSIERQKDAQAFREASKRVAEKRKAALKDKKEQELQGRDQENV